MAIYITLLWIAINFSHNSVALVFWEHTDKLFTVQSFAAQIICYTHSTENSLSPYTRISSFWYISGTIFPEFTGFQSRCIPCYVWVVLLASFNPLKCQEVGKHISDKVESLQVLLWCKTNKNQQNSERSLYSFSSNRDSIGKKINKSRKKKKSLLLLVHLRAQKQHEYSSVIWVNWALSCREDHT